ncbi:Oidioi.mRNA.OKI2018_I69.chr1.g1886.t1.cds [Oikopleura dioica]|uniref:Oidioi.mRNA.OKI2018_I69.chr1.g1886.t1.cds n=1 Tax=Oikopleura dioica TaxID=34765 RepID=A0ABN7SPC3_OIKDI|nr:Oidioi.mRNA.OKI2018_I69.chr1.g1886.t1.cds [Oikopleura dioica]
MKGLAAFVAAASAYSSYDYYDYSSSSSMDGTYNDCGGDITPDQTIIAPTKNGIYYNNLFCPWYIELDASVTSFELVARTFDVEYNSDSCAGCSCDRLHVKFTNADGNDDEVNFCGPNDLPSRRRRNAVGRGYANPVVTGLDRFTVYGNTADLTFYTNNATGYGGFQIDVNILTTESDALSPADAWAEIEAKAADISSLVHDFYADLHHLGSESKLANRKARQFDHFFKKMKNLEKKSSADACDYPVGSNDHSAFLSPIDSDDACQELQGLFDSLLSYADSFVCLKDEKEKVGRVLNPIYRQRNAITSKRLKQMNCDN